MNTTARLVARNRKTRFIEASSGKCACNPDTASYRVVRGRFKYPVERTDTAQRLGVRADFTGFVPEQVGAAADAGTDACVRAGYGGRGPSSLVALEVPDRTGLTHSQ
jgi:hypothetical protein